MSSRDPPAGFKRETWRPQPTSSWTPRQTDSFRPGRSSPSSHAGPSRPLSPSRGDHESRSSRHHDDPGESSRSSSYRDRQDEDDRYLRASGGARDDRFGDQSRRQRSDDARRDDHWRPGEGNGTRRENGRSPPPSSRGGTSSLPNGSGGWRGRSENDRPSKSNRDDRDRWRPPTRGHQDSYRPARSPSPKRSSRRDSPDYGVGRRSSRDEGRHDKSASRRSLSPRPRSPPPRKRAPLSPPSFSNSKRQRQSSPPSSRRGRPTSPALSATSSRFRPSPSRSRSRGRYSLERSRSPPRRRRSPIPIRRARSPSPYRRGRSPSPRDRKSSDQTYRAGGRNSSPHRRISPSPRSPSYPPTSRNRSSTPPRQPNRRDAHDGFDSRRRPSSPRRSLSPDSSMRRASPKPVQLPNGRAPHSASSPSMSPAVQGTRAQNGDRKTPQTPSDPPPPPLPVGSIKIDLDAATNGRRSISPANGGWKSISNGMTPKTVIQQLFDDRPSPPRGPRSMTGSPQRPTAGDQAEQVPSPPHLIAPYIETAFQQWAAQGNPLPLREFLVHYFGRPPDTREVSQMERLVERSKSREVFGGQAKTGDHWSPVQISSRRPSDREDGKRNSSRSPVKEQSANMIPLNGESRYGKPADASMASSANVQLPRPEVTATPAPITEPSPLSAGRQSTKPTRRKTGPGELYERLACVGEGTYGKVYKARNAENGQFVALKRIRMEGEKDGFPVTAMREIKVLQALSHPNVLRLIEMMVSKGSVYMVLEYMDHDLTGLLAHPEIQMSPANIKSLNHQMLSGLAYLHQQGILHRDMKGSNILLSGRGELKLADFGLARTYSKHKRDDYTNRVITLWYRSPELLLGETVYGPEVDMWSAGCIMLELFTSKPVFQGTDEISQLEVIYYVLGTPSETIWPGLGDLPWYELVKPKQELGSRFEDIFSKWLSPAAMDLARGLLTFDPSRRLGAESALETAYFVSELPPMEMPTQLADCGEHHEMSAKIERHRRRQGSK